MFLLQKAQICDHVVLALEQETFISHNAQEKPSRSHTVDAIARKASKYYFKYTRSKDECKNRVYHNCNSVSIY